MYTTQDTIDRQTMFNLTGAIMRRCLGDVGENDKCSVLVANVSDEMVKCARGFTSPGGCAHKIDCMRIEDPRQDNDCEHAVNDAITACMHILRETK